MASQGNIATESVASKHADMAGRFGRTADSRLCLNPEGMTIEALGRCGGSWFPVRCIERILLPIGRVIQSANPVPSAAKKNEEVVWWMICASQCSHLGIKVHEPRVSPFEQHLECPLKMETVPIVTDALFNLVTTTHWFRGYDVEMVGRWGPLGARMGRWLILKDRRRGRPISKIWQRFPI